ncbi:hypothetical protein RADP37_05331 [Roseomonas mucosa]|uniref:Uncharacterized protein n=1 Tax=Roseomonas mucosa TaxID=207340 RepID=A0A4Y1MZD4_9PROT|nr:hypothetical protein [Roseomonas mucosa]AWV23372.1 hypothetical protein RADP37_05331 [Roseomonas mucosa]MDT8356774.1 hypothetical protein [Roseomonas mucosa]MDU7522973.1 hypothetical protein [Roseomonas mucosa]
MCGLARGVGNVSQHRSIAEPPGKPERHERGAPAEAHLADLPQHPLDYSQVRPAQSRGFGPLPSEANVNLLLLRRTMGPITQGLAELSRALKARDQLTVARPVATVGAADTHGGRNSN